MADYTELIKALRHCDSRKSCKECPFYGKDDRSARCKTMIPDAADAIEELDTMLDGVSADNDALCETIERLKKPRWIPVTERLPEEDKLVLVWRNNGFPYVSRRIDSSYWVGLGRGAGVTHWMPLPEPPKEET